MILDHVLSEPATMTGVPASGVWRIQPDGEPRFSRTAFRTHAPADESEAFFMRAIDSGDTTFPGGCLGRFTVRGRLMGERLSRLTERAKAWIRGFRRQFDSSL